MSPIVILLFSDMLTAYQVARSHVQLYVASANYKLLMATVQTYRPTGIELSPHRAITIVQDIHKNSG